MIESWKNKTRTSIKSGSGGFPTHVMNGHTPIFVSAEEFPNGITVVKKVIRENGRLQHYLSILEAVKCHT
jgi:hypothetical protein